MPNLIDFLKQELDNAKKTLNKNLYSHYTNPPKTLYHYTSTDGLLGIIKEHCLHATNVNFMNDYMEMQYAYKLAKEILEEIESSSECPSELSFLRYFEKLHPQHNSWMTPALLEFDKTEVFIVCFSGESNLLSQWRGYGLQGQGYSLGFDTKPISSESIDFLLKVIYDPQIQKNYISNIFKLAFNALKKVKTSLEMENQMDLELFYECRHFISEELLFPILSFKDPGFKEENEWRLVAIRNNDVPEEFSEFKFKNSRGLLTPYIDVDFSNPSDSGFNILPINEIVCGPVLKPELTLKYVAQLLQKYGYPNSIKIISSGIPFRL